MKRIIIGLVLVVVLGGVWFMTKDDSPESKNTIKVGVIVPSTGTGSFWGEYSKNAISLAVEEINTNGGVKGRLIEVIYEDSQTNPSKSVSAFKKLTSIDKVDFVVGDVWDFLTNPLIPLSEEGKVITISPTVMDASVEGSSQYFFTLGHSIESIRNATKTFIRKYPEAKDIAIICLNNAWGQAYTKIYEEVAKEEGRTIVEKNCVLNFDPTYNYLVESTKVKASNPDLVLLNGISYAMVKSLKNIGIKVPILSDSNLVDGFENSNAVSLNQLDNVFVIDWRAGNEFLEKYKQKFGKYPVLEAQNSYESIKSIVMAIENNPDNFLDGLKKVKYEDVGGLIDFTSGKNIDPNKEQAKLYEILGKGQYREVK